MKNKPDFVINYMNFLRVIGLGSISLMLFLLGINLDPIHAGNDVLYVAPEGTCNGPTPCYSNPQDAVDAAKDGDEIRIAAGTYSEVRSIPALNNGDFIAQQVLAVTKPLTLKGGYSIDDWNESKPDTNLTILDAQGNGRVVAFIGEFNAVLDGFQITGGNATGLGGTIIYPDICQPANFPKHGGGGIYVNKANVQITNNNIYKNIGSDFETGGGGGVYLNCSNSELTNNNITENVGATSPSKGYGGGVFATGSGYDGQTTIAVSLRGNIISLNKAGGEYSTGGGVHMGEEVVTEVIGNKIEGNIAAENSNGGTGGGLFLLSISQETMVIDANFIINNRANSVSNEEGEGGGVGVQWCNDFTMTNNIIAANDAKKNGSGIYVYGLQGYPFDGKLLFNTIAGNTGIGDGIYLFGQDFLGGDNNAGLITMKNNILADQETGIYVDTRTDIIVTVQADHTLWDGNGTYTELGGSEDGLIETENDFVGDPSFASNDDFHITAASAALDKGVNSSVNQDIDGESRPAGSAPDIGADELHANLSINYTIGSPGSYFSVSGKGFPVNDTAQVTINGTPVGTANSDSQGNLLFLLSTSQADEGKYLVNATVNPSASVEFSLDAGAPLRAKEQDAPEIEVPAGLSLTEAIFLPMILR